ncbi:IS3 family transposase [Streptomyces sp. NPDC048385]|uniref:IS3 family transposase n=1 Tax=unclassified Streptomyces TaxID=2593676 RepID=UPI0034492940
MNEVYRFIAAEKAVYPVALLCRRLGVARSSFYAWLEAEQARSARERADEALAHDITVIHLASKGAYGVPRVHAELRRLGRTVNRKRVERIMRKRGIAWHHAPKTPRADPPRQAGTTGPGSARP